MLRNPLLSSDIFHNKTQITNDEWRSGIVEPRSKSFFDVLASIFNPQPHHDEQIVSEGEDRTNAEPGPDAAKTDPLEGIWDGIE